MSKWDDYMEQHAQMMRQLELQSQQTVTAMFELDEEEPPEIGGPPG